VYRMVPTPPLCPSERTLNDEVAEMTDQIEVIVTNGPGFLGFQTASMAFGNVGQGRVVAAAARGAHQRPQDRRAHRFRLAEVRGFTELRGS
jgi:hypothetical protein